jgi:hypothetical protein
VEILFFTDSPDVRKILTKNRLNTFGLDELRSKLDGLSEPALVYVDAGSWDGTPENLMSATCKKKPVFLGIIDSSGKIRNPLPLIHKGLVDFISSKDMNADLTRNHCTKVISYIKRYRSDFTIRASNTCR